MKHKKTRPQLLFIHGGITFSGRRSYLDFLKSREISSEKKVRWHEDYLDRTLGRKCEIIRPRMPCAERAVYTDWKIHFERHFPLLRKDLVLVGISLGGIFLAKYLSENRFSKRIRSVYLICPPFDDSLPGEELAGGFRLRRDLTLLEKNCRRLTLLFSKDDPVVPAAHAEKYARRLKKADIIIYESKNGHFKIKDFPELVKMVRTDLRRS